MTCLIIRVGSQARHRLEPSWDLYGLKIGYIKSTDKHLSACMIIINA